MGIKLFKRSIIFLFISSILICGLPAWGTVETYAAVSIPSGIKEYNGHYYYAYTAKSTDTWYNCKDYCEKLGGHLVTLTTEEEDVFVYNLINDTGYDRAFFGLFNAGTPKNPDWQWVTGETVSYTNWASGEPSYYDGSALESYGQFFKNLGSKWNDGINETYKYYSGSFKLLYICEWDSDPNENANSGSTITTNLTVDENLSYPAISTVSQSSTSNVILGWNKVTNATGYMIFRSLDGTNYMLIMTIKSGSTISYKDKTITPGNTYYYKIISTTDTTCSSTSPYYKVDTSLFDSMKKPTLISVTKRSGSKSTAVIKWKKMSGVSGYMIYRKTSSGSYKRVFSIANKSKKSINDVNLKKGKNYSYYLRAYKTVTTDNGKIKYIGPKSNIKKIKIN
jgi:hypothetical protein